MKHSELKELIALAKEEGLSHLKYEGKDGKVEFHFPSFSSNHYPAPVPTPQAPDARVNTNEGEALHVIRSPFVGTFYASPSPGRDAFAKVGQKITVGQTLCILEAMKVMNELESEVSGEIVEVLVENEALVEYNQPLFKIRT